MSIDTLDAIYKGFIAVMFILVGYGFYMMKKEGK